MPHFCSDVLRAVGAWDPYNVTEDADLGMRLARFGYRSAMIESTTYEEAPARPGLWLRQRTRWFKGWMQTWAVHMRAPARLWRELGPGGFIAFQLVVGGNVLAALVHTLFLAWLAYQFTRGEGLHLGGDADGTLLTVFYAAALGAGYLVSVTLGFFGLARRGLLKSAWALAMVMLHWLLLSLAAWRALFHLVYDPFGWEKTAHGLGRSSRRARMNSSATLEALFRREVLTSETAPPLRPQQAAA